MEELQGFVYVAVRLALIGGMLLLALSIAISIAL